MKMTQYCKRDFFEKLALRHPRDVQLIEWAYWIAKNAHREQKRDHGERYFEHCKRVALILSERDNCTATEIILALLHDCIEDTYIPESMLRHLFYDFISDALATLTKFTVIYDTKTGSVLEKKKKTNEKYFSLIAKAPLYVRRVKLADRLDNLRGMETWTNERILRYCDETEEYILPIARNCDEFFYRELTKNIAHLELTTQRDK
ncbi:MAG: HD domain-containing protein [Candidatus Colwellbacteria bacterium]|nr:HD domain-containing protein [Candidatus Colwellbacteria bacterium]